MTSLFHGANPSNSFIPDMNPYHQSDAIAQNEQRAIVVSVVICSSHGEALVFYLLDEESFLQLLIFKCSLVGQVGQTLLWALGME